MARPGKFEGCADERLGRVLYDISLEGGCNEDLGDVEGGFGWYGLVLSRKRAYIVCEDSNGFFTYDAYPTHTAAQDAWAMLEQDWAEVA